MDPDSYQDKNEGSDEELIYSFLKKNNKYSYKHNHTRNREEKD